MPCFATPIFSRVLRRQRGTAPHKSVRRSRTHAVKCVPEFPVLCFPIFTKNRVEISERGLCRRRSRRRPPTGLGSCSFFVIDALCNVFNRRPSPRATSSLACSHHSIESHPRRTHTPKMEKLAIAVKHRSVRLIHFFRAQDRLRSGTISGRL